MSQITQPTVRTPDIYPTSTVLTPEGGGGAPTIGVAQYSAYKSLAQINRETDPSPLRTGALDMSDTDERVVIM